MWCGAKEIRVNIWLQIRTFRKYVAFFLFLFLLLAGTNGVKKTSAATSPSGHPGQTITVTATVPLTLEYGNLIIKNSDISLTKNAFIVGDEGVISVHLQGGEKEVLKNHVLELHIFNKEEEEVVFQTGTTDSSGNARFTVMFGELFLGENTARVIDTTYGSPLEIKEKPRFTVYDEREDAEKNTEKSILIGINAHVGNTSEPFRSGAYEVIDPYEYEKNVTMGTSDSVAGIARAGPDIPL